MLQIVDFNRKISKNNLTNFLEKFLYLKRIKLSNFNIHYYLLNILLNNNNYLIKQFLIRHGRDKIRTLRM